MLYAQRISKTFDGKNRVLRNVDLKLEKGQFVALLGRSGSGKTTLLRCCTLLDEPSEGRIYFNDIDLLNLKAKEKMKYRRKWAYIGQKTSLIRRKSALDNALAGRLNDLPLWKVLLGKFSDEDRQKATRALERVGLGEMASRRADQLSGGQQQRVAIARAIAQEATLIFADEPVASLDPESAKRVLTDLRNLCEETGVAILCSLHQVDLAEAYATRIVGLAGGRIALDTPARALTNGERQIIYNEQEEVVFANDNETTAS